MPLLNGTVKKPLIIGQRLLTWSGGWQATIPMSLSAAGLDPQPAAFPHMNAKALFFKDPEGNQLELICHAPSGT